MATRRPATNDNIRDLMNDMRLELKGDIGKVADQVTKLSQTVNDNEIKQAVSSTKIGMLITGVTIAMSTLTTVVVDKITGKIH